MATRLFGRRLRPLPRGAPRPPAGVALGRGRVALPPVDGVANAVVASGPEKRALGQPADTQPALSLGRALRQLLPAARWARLREAIDANTVRVAPAVRRAMPRALGAGSVRSLPRFAPRACDGERGAADTSEAALAARMSRAAVAAAPGGGRRVRSLRAPVSPGDVITVPEWLYEEGKLPRWAAPLGARALEVKPGERRKLLESVLYEDEDLILLNKPAGLAVQGGTGVRAHLDGMLHVLAASGGSGVRGLPAPRVVHRLDRDASGVLALARTPGAARSLARAFEPAQSVPADADNSDAEEAGETASLDFEDDSCGSAAAVLGAAARAEGGESNAAPARAARCTYWALVAPPPRRAEGRIVTRCRESGALEASRFRVVEVAHTKRLGDGSGGSGCSGDGAGGARNVNRGAGIARPARASNDATAVDSNESDGGVGVVDTSAAWVELVLETGRKHQLRRHMAEHLGCPIVGDWRYPVRRRRAYKPLTWPDAAGGESASLHLHCRSLSVPHPADPSGATRVSAEAPLPTHMARTWEKLFPDAHARLARRQWGHGDRRPLPAYGKVDRGPSGRAASEARALSAREARQAEGYARAQDALARAQAQRP